MRNFLEALAKTRKRSTGQALVEFALALPILLLLVMGAIDIATVVFAYNRMTAAAREGVRVAAESTLCDADILPFVQNRAARVLADSGIPANAAAPQPAITSNFGFAGLGQVHSDVSGNFQDSYRIVTISITYTPNLFFAPLISVVMPAFNPTLNIIYNTYRNVNRATWP